MAPEKPPLNVAGRCSQAPPRRKHPDRHPFRAKAREETQPASPSPSIILSPFIRNYPLRLFAGFSVCGSHCGRGTGEPIALASGAVAFCPNVMDSLRVGAVSVCFDLSRMPWGAQVANNHSVLRITSVHWQIIISCFRNISTKCIFDTNDRREALIRVNYLFRAFRWKARNAYLPFVRRILSTE